MTVVGLLAAGCGSTGTKAGPTTTVARTGAGTTASSHGPFAVGVRTETFTDTSRKTPANGSVPEKPGRTLETIIEYPAQGTPDPNVEKSRAAAASGKFPVTLFVHGFSAHASNPYLHPWAAAGFIAVAITFPLTNADTPGGATRSDTVNEPADVRFVLSQLAHLPAEDADLQPIIDASRVGLMGQSLVRWWSSISVSTTSIKTRGSRPSFPSRVGVSDVLRASRIPTARFSPVRRFR